MVYLTGTEDLSINSHHLHKINMWNIAAVLFSAFMIHIDIYIHVCVTEH